MRILKFLFFQAVTTMLVIACGGPGQKAQSDLKDAVLRFNEGVRWGRLQEVMPRIDPAAQEHFMKMHEKFGSEIGLSDYELINSSYDNEKKTANVTVRITWYRHDAMELQSTVLLQEWALKGADWVMMTETYQSGEPF